MEFQIAFAEDRVPSTKEPDPYMHIFLDAGVDMTFDFTRLISHAAKSRPRAAGGRLDHRLGDGVQQAWRRTGKPITEGGVGYSCIAEMRTIETIESGVARMPFLKYGDRIRIEMLDAAGGSIFSAVDQVVEKIPSNT